MKILRWEVVDKHGHTEEAESEEQAIQLAVDWNMSEPGDAPHEPRALYIQEPTDATVFSPAARDAFMKYAALSSVVAALAASGRPHEEQAMALYASIQAFTKVIFVEMGKDLEPAMKEALQAHGAELAQLVFDVSQKITNGEKP